MCSYVKKQFQCRRLEICKTQNRITIITAFLFVVLLSLNDGMRLMRQVQSIISEMSQSAELVYMSVFVFR